MAIEMQLASRFDLYPKRESMLGKSCNASKWCLFVVVFFVGSAFASATPVDFYTVGQFSGSGATIDNAAMSGPGTSSATVKGCFFFSCTTSTLSFTGTRATGIVPPQSIDLGNFSETPGFWTGSFNGVGFDLYVFQTSPSIGNNDFVGSISGSLGWFDNTLEWTPDQASKTFTIGGDTYTLTGLDRGGDLDLGQDCSGTDVDARLEQSMAVTPEPPSLLLMGTGLAALIGLFWSKRYPIGRHLIGPM